MQKYLGAGQLWGGKILKSGTPGSAMMVTQEVLIQKTKTAERWGDAATIKEPFMGGQEKKAELGSFGG